MFLMRNMNVTICPVAAFLALLHKPSSHLESVVITRDVQRLKCSNARKAHKIKNYTKFK